MNLTVRSLSFAYHEKPLLDNVSLELHQGQVLCVLGPNGVGKSTLFRCILGLQKGYSGSASLDGDEISALLPKELSRRIAYIPQFSAPVFSYSVFHTVLMGASTQLGPMESPGAAQKKTAMDALERLKITYLKDRITRTLSGGERQLVLIARALAQNSPLLVMDEPTASLDYGNSIRVMDMVKSLAEQGYGIILSTHDPNQALCYGSQALVLAEGRVQSFGPPSDAVTSEVLSAIYGVPINIVSLSAGGTSYKVCIPTPR